MKTVESKRAAMVGLFILFSIALLVTGTLILGGQQKRFEKTITLKAVFDDIEGLKQGNNIWFSGVKVGAVNDIGFHGQSQVEVSMRVERKVQQYIRKNAKVRLSTDGFIGNKILLIEGGSVEAPQVESGDLLESVAPLNTDDMMATLQENNRNLVDITRNFKELSSQLVSGEGALGALFSDSLVAINFKQALHNLETVSANTAMASDALAQFTSKLNTEDGLVNNLLTDTLVFHQLRSSVAELQKSSYSVAELAGNLSTATDKLGSTNNALGTLLNDRQFSEQLKNVMENLESGSGKLDENLEALQHNFLFRGYFRNKEKEEQREARRLEKEGPVDKALGSK